MNTISSTYILAVLSGFLLTAILVWPVKKIAWRFGLVDWSDKISQPAGSINQPSSISQPANTSRKIHQKSTPLLGGLAIFLSVFALIFVFRFFRMANFSLAPDKHLLAIFGGGLLIMIGGFLDDKFNLKPRQQIIWPALAALVAILAGINIGYITNPLGGPQNAIIYLPTLIGGVLAFFWFMGMMYTTKFLDGLDGLVSGITVIAAVVIFLVSLNWDVALSATGIWALILAGSAAGFLVFNWPPAKIFLGEGGSLFAGFMLAALSIISGSKITATLLVIGLPALDVLWVIIRRLARRESPFSHADQKHLHYQLLTLGLKPREIVLCLYLIALIFGFLAVVSLSLGKLLSLLLLIVFTAILIGIIYFHDQKTAKSANLDKSRLKR